MLINLNGLHGEKNDSDALRILNKGDFGGMRADATSRVRLFGDSVYDGFGNLA